MTHMIDTLQLADELKAADFSEDQAKGLARAMNRVAADSLATKADLKDLEYRLTLRLGGLTVTTAGVLFALLKLT